MTRGIILKFIVLSIIGIHIVACGGEPVADTPRSKDLRREIRELTEVNRVIEIDLPILIGTSDTLLAIIQKLRQEHAKKLLIKQLADVQASIEKHQQAYRKNKSDIIHKIAELQEIKDAGIVDSTYLISSDTVLMPSSAMEVYGDTITPP